MVPRLVLALVFATLFVAEARADVATPGEHSVGYSFGIDNASAFPDCAFLAYPWSLSNGAPTREYVELGAEPVGLGRRSDTPKIYAMSRTDFEQAKKEGALPAPEKSRDFTALEPFFASARVHVTQVALDPPGLVKDSSPLVARRDVLHVESCNASKGADVALTAVEYRYKDGTSETKPYGAPPRAASCAACSMADTRARASAAIGALALLAAAAAARRAWYRRACARPR